MVRNNVYGPYLPSVNLSDAERVKLLSKGSLTNLEPLYAGHYGSLSIPGKSHH